MQRRDRRGGFGERRVHGKEGLEARRANDANTERSGKLGRRWTKRNTCQRWKGCEV